jgi:flagellar assembly protein FliH
MSVAERIVHTEITENPRVVVENVRQALTRLVSREVVTLRINPADLEMIRRHRDALVASSDIEHLRVVEDHRVDRGGVVIETEAGTIDAKISTQVREARRAISDDDTIALGPSHGPTVHAPAQAS